MVWVLCVRAGIARISVGLLGLGRSFFIGGGMDCSFLRLREVLLWSIVGITADRAFSSNFVGCKSISPNRLGRTILEKAFVRFRLLMI